ncbi:MAG: hypothetical protein ACRDPW_03860 [Mycobacteriales bacterium]
MQQVNDFHIHQRVTLMTNRYDVFADDGAGKPGARVAFVQQKRMAFKERVTAFTDESSNTVLFELKARSIFDAWSRYDVFDATGASIGLISKQFGRSLFRSTWKLDQPGQLTSTGQERRPIIAVLRRIWGFLPYVGDLPGPFSYHFDFSRGGQYVFSLDKTTRFRDRYRLRIVDPTLDRRLAVATAIALDALQSR